MRPRSLDASWLVALLLVAGCFNPEPPESADTDDGSGEPGSTSDADPDPEPEPDGSTGEALSATESSGGPEDTAICGDGTVQGGEECDLGSDNDDAGACTASCTIAVCGDGVVHLGSETCDDGDASAECDADCTVAECGDGVLNPLAFEQCDGDDDVMNGHCSACVAVCDPGWSRCGGGPAAACDSVIDSQAACLECGHEWRDVTLRASEHISVDSQWGPMPQVAFVQSAYYDPNYVTGWIGFDFDTVDTPIHLTQARLEIHAMIVDFGPIVDIVVDDTHSWTPAELQPGNVLVLDYVPEFMGFLAIDINVDAWDWARAAQAGWFNLGFVPRGPMGSMMEIEGTHAPDLAPALRLQGCF